jgi:hypothetical protein
MFAELLGFPSGELGSAVISRICDLGVYFYENAYRGSDQLLSHIPRSNRYVRY